MKAVIIEDEKPAREKLEVMLKEYDPLIEVIASLESVEESINWIAKNKDEPDLYFMDILLTDGQSFDIFEKVEINKPVIFITAYNDYAIKAFKVNSIDYLLKPLNYKDLSKSLDKLMAFGDTLPGKNEQMNFRELGKVLSNLNNSYKKRFMVKVGMHILSVKAENIDLFFAEGRTVFVLSSKQNKYIVDYTLDELMRNLDPNMFFRANRSIIVNINAIKEVLVYSNSRLRIKLHQEFDKEIIVSRDRVNNLKTWFEGS